VARYNNKYSNLDAEATIRWFTTLDKPGEVRLLGSKVVGKIVPGRVSIKGPWTMAEKFANWPTDETAILRFTEKYGPLCQEWIVDGRFSFEIQDWRNWQRFYRDFWKSSCPVNLPPPETIGIGSYGDLPVGLRLDGPTFLTVHQGTAALGLPDLRRLLDVCLTFVPLERRRVCRAEGCKSQYFVAHRLDRTLCGSAACEHWNQKRLKREWFDNNKAPILEERKRRRRKGGTQKAG
jgi:hypothetical protein